ncbi:hypothetical protein LEMLEM_LOCUS15048, partial [Lemmus lemmus]
MKEPQPPGLKNRPGAMVNKPWDSFGLVWPTSHKRELGQNLYPTSSKVGTSSTPPLPAVGAVSSHKVSSYLPQHYGWVEKSNTGPPHFKEPAV